MTYVLFAFFFLLGLIKKDNKYICGLIFLYMFVLAGFNENNIDMMLYRQRFENPDSVAEITEILYFSYIQILKFMGCDFRMFVILSQFAFLSAVFAFIIKVTAQPAFVASLYMLFSYAVDSVQIRSALAFSLVLGGIYYLSKGGKINVLRFLALCGIATMIHGSAAFYFLVILVLWIPSKKHVEYTLLALAMAVSFALTQILKGGLEIDTTNLPTYFANKLSYAPNEFRQVIVFTLKSYINVGLLFVLLTILETELENMEDPDGRLLHWIRFVRKLNIAVMPVFFLYFISCDLYRIQRYLTVVNLCVLSYGFAAKQECTKGICLFRALACVWFGGNFYMYMINNGDITRTLLCYLQYNLLIP